MAEARTPTKYSFMAKSWSRGPRQQGWDMPAIVQAGEDERRHPTAQAQQMQAGAGYLSAEEMADRRRRQALRATRDERD